MKLSRDGNSKKERTNPATLGQLVLAYISCYWSAGSARWAAIGHKTGLYMYTWRKRQTRALCRYTVEIQTYSPK